MTDSGDGKVARRKSVKDANERNGMRRNGKQRERESRARTAKLPVFSSRFYNLARTRPRKHHYSFQHAL